MSQRVSHGDGLYLYNDSSWVFMYKYKGKRRERGLGSSKAVTLAQAKKIVRAHRAKLDMGVEASSISRTTSGSFPVNG